jgi:hypothetical protein
MDPMANFASVALRALFEGGKKDVRGSDIGGQGRITGNRGSASGDGETVIEHRGSAAEIAKEAAIDTPVKE